MKILLGTDTYPPTINGTARFTERYAHAMAARGHEVHVVCPSPSGLGGTDRHDQVTVHEIASVGYRYYEGFRICLPLAAAVQTRHIVARVRPDVVHIQDNFLVGRGLATASHRYGVPVVATNHLMPANFFDHVPVPQPLRRWGAGRLWVDVAKVYRRAAVVTSPTPKAVELLTAATGLAALPISNGIDLERYQRAAQGRRVGPGLHGDVPTVLFVGRLDQEKRVHELIAAMGRLPDALPARLEIVGTGTLRGRLEALAAPLGDRVVFRGFLSDNELLDAYARADIFAMPGVAELQSLVTLEAMASGKPVIAADAMALPHLCHDGQNGYLFQPGDVDGLAERLRRLLSDAELRHRMGEESVRIVAHHGFAATLARFEAIYAGLQPGYREPRRNPVVTPESAER